MSFEKFVRYFFTHGWNHLNVGECNWFPDDEWFEEMYTTGPCWGDPHMAAFMWLEYITDPANQ